MPRIVITELDQTGQPYRFELERELVSMGRRENNDIVFKCRSTSSNHCTMERVDGGFILRDQDSTNGIKKDDSLMQIIDLRDGMEISMGDVTLDFQLSKEEIETLSREFFVPQQTKKQPDSSPEDEAPQKKPLALKENTSSATKNDEPEPAESPTPAAPETPAIPSGYSQPVIQSGVSSLKPLLFFILIIAAIFTGMSVSHKLRTGHSLPNKLVDSLKRKPVAEKANELEDSSNSSEDQDQGIDN
jgi:predicted component of type VI protein secretion system